MTSLCPAGGALAFRIWLTWSLALLMVVLPAERTPTESALQASSAEVASSGSGYELASRIEFNGGAIVDLAAADAGSLLVLAGMPSGFSIFRLSESGECQKFVSAGYLASLLGEEAKAQDWELHFDPATSMLVLLPRREGRLLVLDASDAPRLKRYRMGLPVHFRPGALAFLPGGGLLLYSGSFLPGASRAQLILFDPGKLSLTPVQLERPLSIILRLHPVDAGRAVALGYFTAEDAIASPMLATVRLEDGKVELWPESGGALLLAGAGPLLGVVRRRRTEVIPADCPGAAYELAVLDAGGRLAAGTRAVPVFIKPRDLVIGADAHFALILVSQPGGFSDLWLVDLRSQRKELVEQQVMLAGMMAGGNGFYLVPAGENAVRFYRLRTEGE